MTGSKKTQRKPPRFPKHARPDAPTDFGRNLRRLRIELGFSQERLGLMAGLSRETVTRLESGAHQSPDVDTIGNLASALGVQPAELFLEAGTSVSAMEPQIQRFLKSACSQILSPKVTEEELTHLRRLPGLLWLGVAPNPEVLYHYVLAFRARETTTQN